MRHTSIKAYYEILPKIGARQRQVLEALSSGPKTNRQISKMTGLEVNAVTPRTNELVKLGLVSSRGVIVDPESNKSVTVWSMVGEQLEMNL